MKTAIATLGGVGSVAAAVATVGWPVIAVVAGLAVLVLAETAWVLKSLDRSHRLAMLIVALRGGPPVPPGDSHS